MKHMNGTYREHINLCNALPLTMWSNGSRQDAVRMTPQFYLGEAAVAIACQPHNGSLGLVWGELPSYVCWFINPTNYFDISTINHSYPIIL